MLLESNSIEIEESEKTLSNALLTSSLKKSSNCKKQFRKKRDSEKRKMKTSLRDSEMKFSDSKKSLKTNVSKEKIIRQICSSYFKTSTPNSTLISRMKRLLEKISKILYCACLKKLAPESKLLQEIIDMISYQILCTLG